VGLDRPPGRVDPQAVVLDRLPPIGALRQLRPPQERPNAAPELADRERLRDVVVRTDLQTEHLVDLVVAGRQHDDGNGAQGTHAAAHLEPVHPGEHEIQNDEIGMIGGKALEGFLPAPRLDDLVSLPLERVGQELLNGLLVVDEQNGRGARHCLGRLRGDQLIETTIALCRTAAPATR
jgi:hypothetical protein